MSAWSAIDDQVMNGDAIRRWWAAQVRAWEALHRAHRPWEQEGSLRWQRRLGSGWELHGSTLPPTTRP